MFIQSVIPIFKGCKTFLQSSEPLVHVLHYNTLRLYKSLLSRFVEAEVLPAVESDLDSICINLELNLKECIKKRISKNLSYLVKSVLVLNDDVIKSLTFLRLSDRHKATMNEMSILLKLFLRLGPKNVSDLESELLEFQSRSDSELPPYFDENDKPNRIYTVWMEIAKLKEGSRDNMSVILITFPAASTVCLEAVEKEKKLDETIKMRIKEIVEEKGTDTTLSFVLDDLQKQNLENLPPGGGIHSKLCLIEETLDHLLPNQPKDENRSGVLSSLPVPLSVIRHIASDSNEMETEENTDCT